MRFSIHLIVFAMVVYLSNGNSDDDAWNAYKFEYKKDYSSSSEDDIHKAIFLAHRQQINQHNSGASLSYRKELNRFSDMWPSEKSKYLGLKSSMAPSSQLMMKSIHLGHLLGSQQALSVKFDYRSDICMAAVKDQGSCGSCWAFAAVAPIEFNYCKKHKQTPIVLSEQQLVDCDKIDGGCSGGWYTQTWKYIKITGGIVRDSKYPYTATQSSCPIPFWFFLASARVFMISYIPANDAVTMQVALQKLGPLAVAFAVAESFYSYMDGVYDDTDCDNLDVNHAMVIVGWGNQNGLDYWIVRNSWGTGWGDSGYVLIQRGVNKCQIEFYAAFVLPF
ncbi:ervatamin-B-like [Daphnia pulex]|uniref:ervatamin-B-like n=1 Tax=Daphnia pulex TaxID=6669 RepID=UPI001EE0669A|nr:ervatamin-B-like [Daphnia pulex]